MSGVSPRFAASYDAKHRFIEIPLDRPDVRVLGTRVTAQRALIIAVERTADEHALPPLWAAYFALLRL